MSGDDQEPAAGGEQKGRGRSRAGHPHGQDARRPHGTQVRGPALLAFKARWEALDPRHQLRLKQAAVALSIAALGGGIYAASSSADQDETPQAPAASLDMGAGLRGDSLEFKMRGDLQKILEGQTLLNDRVTAMEEGRLAPGAGAPAADREGALPQALPGSIPDFPEPPSPSDIAGADGSLPPPPAAPVPAAPPAPPVERQVGAIGSASTIALPADGPGSAAGDGSKKKSRTIYLPPGFMKARLLTGIDALASRDATSNPEPLIARVQAPAVLPNDVKANLSGCFVIGNATGSLAKERVEVQLVSLSCVDFKERSVVDQPIKGFFVDTDGKKGLSGKVVTRAGAALARSFIAGTVSGMSQSVETTFGETSTSALGSVRSFDPADAAKSGIAGGISKSSEKLTDFYLDLARQAGPIVEVGAAKDVVVVIQEGVALEIKPTAATQF
ncbi:TraB/VirB10 family protein [Sphingobium sp. AN558]|uniref:TraB/VirB10 family protein n=1 Tax=Sphingobium sp. AN558 TaxID=3133442 RepID=UPI0030BAD5A6